MIDHTVQIALPIFQTAEFAFENAPGRSPNSLKVEKGLGGAQLHYAERFIHDGTYRSFHKPIKSVS